MTGLDTETFRGNLKVICSPTAFFEPTGKLEDLLAWIVNNGAEVVWLYNLSYDSDVILKMCFKAVDIMHNNEAKARFLIDHSMQIGEFEITLIGHKSFRIKRESEEHGKQRIDCFDVSAFMTEGERHVTLEYASQKVLGEGKSNEELGIDRKSIGTVEGYYKEHREAIIQYCKQDASLTMRLGEYLCDVAHEALSVYEKGPDGNETAKIIKDIYPRRWSSAASLSKAWLEVRHPELMVRNKKGDVPFRNSFRGGLFVTRMLGRIKNQTEADISNAYGSAISNLKNTEGLQQHSGPDRRSDAVFGAYYITTHYDGKLPWRLSDMGLSLPKKKLKSKKEKDAAARPQEKVLYPLGEDENKNTYCATKIELDYFDEEGIDYDVIWADELCGEPKGLMFPDFEPLAKRVAAMKNDAKKIIKIAMLREILKRVLNSVYGCLAESKHGETVLTTWPLAAEITASCRVKIWREWRKIERGGGEVISINTDSARYCPGTYHVLVTPGVLGLFENKFVGHTVTHYQSGVAMIEHPPKCGCHEEPELERVLRADDGLGSVTPYPLETRTQARERLREAPAPHEEGGLEIHATTCPCKRCLKAPRVALRKRGMPTLTPARLLMATGHEIEVVSTRPIHAIEGVLQNRIADVADIPDSEEAIAVDDGSRRRGLSLLSNLVTGVYAPEDLTYPRLNAGPVQGEPIPMHALLERKWIKEAIRMRRQAEEDYDENYA